MSGAQAALGRPAGPIPAGLTPPALMVYGTADPVGSVDGWRRFAGRLPHGELEVVDGGGHMPWYDDPARVGARVARFLDS